MTPTDRDLERARKVMLDVGFDMMDDSETNEGLWWSIASALAEERAAVLGRLTEGDVVEAGASAVDELIVPFHTRADAVVFARAALAAVAALLEPKGSR